MALPEDKPKRRFFTDSPEGFERPTHDKRVYHEFTPGEILNDVRNGVELKFGQDRRARRVYKTYNRPEAIKRLTGRIGAIIPKGRSRSGERRPMSFSWKYAPRNEPTALSVSDELIKYFGRSPRDTRPPINPWYEWGRHPKSHPEAKGPRGTKKGTRMHKEREALRLLKQRKLAAEAAAEEHQRRLEDAHNKELRKKAIENIFRIWEGKAPRRLKHKNQFPEVPGFPYPTG